MKDNFRYLASNSKIKRADLQSHVAFTAIRKLVYTEWTFWQVYFFERKASIRNE